MAKVVPQINQIMQTLQSQFAMDASQPSVLADENPAELTGQTVEEAFRVY
jgi:hypothetical protein